MAKIVNFVYSMIIFVSLFLVATKGGSKPFLTRPYPCNTGSDCPQNMCPPGYKPGCEDGYCNHCYKRW
ncbi:putative Late nodulin [Medicago truncatula]|uniref:Nodule Cysteine-Rich (NCR) secreted peptide n=1 Tax=Medicago truncatula TaxID=3880 RepID=A7KH89_MEDTR|nr:nodule-specific cysteine-rich peptide 103 [Medicago truncatula]AES69449.1 Nodule Cysteine-Rich (NCR) secreted peptide [Medicago truncatula]AFK40298.1 unknown [Medicago truncatula]KEH33241.1 Nodule Cysteine-Rich (NCR) secreted peptide [Medicago truncatula]RHN66253.1 putative Late nodulin [Medicago truncatula]